MCLVKLLKCLMLKNPSEAEMIECCIFAKWIGALLRSVSIAE